MSSAILRPNMISRMIVANARFVSTASIRPILGLVRPARSSASQPHSPRVSQYPMTVRFVSKEAKAKVEARTAAVKSSQTYEERVKKIVIDQLGVRSEEVTNSASFVDDLGADSLDIVEMMIDFEKEFDIEIPDKEAENISTVQAAIDYVTTKLYQKKSN